jgi:hypothetical protein
VVLRLVLKSYKPSRECIAVYTTLHTIHCVIAQLDSEMCVMHCIDTMLYGVGFKIIYIFKSCIRFVEGVAVSKRMETKYKF